jgi:hypothetical protein
MAINPIAFTEQVIDDFLHYQLTTYPLADQDLYSQLKALLRLDQTRDTPLRKGPFISLSRPFKQGASIQRLVDDDVFHPGMLSVVPYERLRSHQQKAIESVHRGDTTLISTGTGSGKTEAFLYPIISRCLELKDAGRAARRRRRADLPDERARRGPARAPARSARRPWDPVRHVRRQDARR